MADPELELQGAIVTTLKADAEVTALVAGRVYDRVPEDAPFPYISIGPSDAIQTDADCIWGYDILLQLDVWSRAVGFPESKRIADTIRVALHDTDLVLSTNALVFLEWQSSRSMRDPDGLTSHAVITLHAFVEKHPPPVH